MTEINPMYHSTANEIKQRLASLREIMAQEHLSAFIFPSTDPHNSEYVADHWKGRAYISGFDGSAGTAVVTMNDAALWTDSRYFIAANEQLEGTSFQLMKMGMPDTPTIAEWLEQKLSSVSSPEIGIDGNVNALAEVESLITEMRQRGGITVRTNFDPLQTIWTNRPAIPQNPISIHALTYAGEDITSKVARIRTALRSKHADGILVTALDDIAWTLNLRGCDVHCNPVFVAYLLISTTKIKLYVDAKKLSPEVSQYLDSFGVELHNYTEVGKGLEDYEEYNILIDPNMTNYQLAKRVKCPAVVHAPSPIPALKAIKNSAEIEGFKQAMLRDGIAIVKFLAWLKPAVAKGGQTEVTLAKQLEAFRSEQPHYKGISFETIVGYEANGAIVHYEATVQSAAQIQPKGWVLIDSGAQYLDGTTDITRTIALGELTDEQRLIYTLVLKGHIGLDQAVFPNGACGSQIDVLARQAMWKQGYNFLHGTGHGVGSYLNVHEGPHQIRMEWRPAPLHEGMTVTNEPGIYVEGKYGIRIENVLLTIPHSETQYGKFLTFEALTLAPIDTIPLIKELMTEEEIEWLNNYHQKVWNALSPHLEKEEKEWLRGATLKIAK